MNLEHAKHKKLFQLSLKNNDEKKKVSFFGKGRILLGRSETCDFIVDHSTVSVIHAVLEIFEDHAILYDMNSTHGVFYDDKKVIVQRINPGDLFILGQQQVFFQYFNQNEKLPPFIDQEGVRIINEKSLPSSQPVEKVGPRVIYPLASNPHAEFSEYIFEDADEIYPIFDYDYSKQSVEVIILFKDQVLSIDYLSSLDGVYELAGVSDSEASLEFPYLGLREKVPFINFKSKTPLVYPVPGFDILCLNESEDKSAHHAPEIELNENDILRFQKNDLQIFVRTVSKPPTVARAPFLRRDKVLRHYLLTFLSLFLVLFFLIQFTEAPQIEKNEELASERLATILYKQPLILSNKPIIDKTKNKKRKIQKTPQKISTKPSKEKSKIKSSKSPSLTDNKSKSTKNAGEKNVKEIKIVKKGTPQQSSSPAKKNPKNSSTKAASKLSKTATSSNKTQNSPRKTKTKGHVEVYKSIDFKSSVNALLTKSGNLTGGSKLKGVSLSSPTSINGIESSVSAGSGNVKTVKISTTEGSLKGVNSGALGKTKGAEGLSSKKAIFTAGIPSETLVFGSMDPDVIRRRLMEFLPQFRSCYQRELQSTGNLINGLIKLNFVIGSSGHVVKSGLTNKSSSTLPRGVSRCVLNVLNGISFPEPRGGGRVEVNQPMNFQPKAI